MGDILGQINSRRGTILGMEVRQGNAQAAQSNVPLAEMFGYATELRSATQGRGVFTMEFDHYAPVSETVAQKIINRNQLVIFEAIITGVRKYGEAKI